jgi:uncharacterized protein YkwD
MKAHLAGALAAALCLAAAPACDDDDGYTDQTDYEAGISACVDRINEFRATLDLPALARWTDAETCADDQARQDSESDSFHGAFGQCDEYAQNECPGWGSVDQIVDGCLQMMWDEGPGEPYSEHGHYINMTNTSYTEVACGFYTTPDGAVWSVQDFR